MSAQTESLSGQRDKRHGESTWVPSIDVAGDPRVCVCVSPVDSPFFEKPITETFPLTCHLFFFFVPISRCFSRPTDVCDPLPISLFELLSCLAVTNAHVPRSNCRSTSGRIRTRHPAVKVVHQTRVSTLLLSAVFP